MSRLLQFAACSALLAFASPASAYSTPDQTLPATADAFRLGFLEVSSDQIGLILPSQDLLQEARRGRGADDPAGDDRGGRRGRGADDGPNHASIDQSFTGDELLQVARRGRGRDDGPNHG